jgi:hypothetical protein
VPIPRGSRLDSIEAEYGPLTESVPCGKLDCQTPHKRGFLVTFADPQGVSGRAIIGHVCGKRQFGQVWKEARARHIAEVRKAQVQEAAADFLRLAADVEPRLRVLLPSLEARHAVRQALAIDARSFMRACEEACRGDGYLRTHRDGVSVRLHRVEGRLFFTQDNALKRARLALESISIMRRTLDEGTASVKEIGERIGRLGDLRHTTEVIEQEAADGRTALRPAHMERLLRAIAATYSGWEEVRMEGACLLVARRLTAHSDFKFRWTSLGDLTKVIG